MNKSQKVAHQKQLREQARFRKAKKKAETEEAKMMMEDMDEEDMEDEEESDDSGASYEEEKPKKKKKELQKEYTMEGGEMMWHGPTSFAELDAMEDAREKAGEISRVSWQVQDLVYNIIQHPMLEPSQKGKAIKALGDDFEERVNDILSGEVTEKDLDLLSIEAVMAHDARHSSALERATDWLLQKRVLSSRARNKLSDEQFALPEKRKYPIHDKAHVRNALARAAQQIKRGGEAAADAKAALPKIRAAAKKFGIEMDTEKEKTGILIEKDATGTWRWVGWSTNKFKDLDGEILSSESHKEFTGWLDQNPDMAPVFMSWHTPETVRKNAVDFWMYENGFLIMSGPLMDVEAEGLLRVQKEIDLGMSHGTIVLRRDPQNRKIITKYRMYEVSELPLENAANPFTSFDTVIKEAGMDKKKYFMDLFGEAKAEKYLALTKEAEQKLEDAGVQHKEQKAEKAEEKKVEATKPVLDAKTLDELTKALGERFGLEDLSQYLAQYAEALEKVPVLEELVKALSENQDQALADKINPPASSFVWMQKKRASQSDDTKLKENEADEKLKKARPDLDPAEDWLSVQTGTQPVRAQ